MPSESKFSGTKQEGKESAVRKNDDVDLVDAVSTFFYENEEFAGKFEAFVKANCHKIDLKETEYRLEHTDLYQTYQRLFEDSLTEFIEDQGSTVREFYEKVRAATEKDPFGKESIFAQILAATADFDIFMLMMRETKESMRDACGADLEPLEAAEPARRK
ncbi:unnamed protein product [Phaeothamnion confervicola]